MRATHFIKEASPNSLKGSFSEDLISSKLWLIQKLKKLIGNQSIETIYILGSWYGNIALFLKKSNIKFDRLVLIDIDDSVLKKSEKLLRPLFKPEQLVFLHTDAKDVIYDKPGIVINTSTNDMSTDWLNSVPDNTLVVIQGRNNVNKDTNIKNIDNFNKLFPLKKTYYLGEKELKDPETEYTRYMKIGRK